MMHSALFTLWVLLGGANIPPVDQGPIQDNGSHEEDYGWFRWSVARFCYSEELSGAASLPTQTRGEHIAHWLKTQAMGPDFARRWKSIGEATHSSIREGELWLATALEAEVGRCPFAEDVYRTAAVELRARCAKKEAVACSALPEMQGDLDRLVDGLIADAKRWCGRGRKATCDLPNVYEQMRKELRVGAPAPQPSKAIQELLSAPAPKRGA